MKAWLQVLRREWMEWRLLVAGAFLLGWFPWAAPLLPGTDHLAPSDVRQAAAILVLVLVGVGAVGFLAPALLARDLASRRLSFFLTRPLSSATLWSARVVAIGSVLMFVLLLVSLPTLVAEPDVIRALGSSADQPAAPLSALGEFFSLRAQPDLPAVLSPALRIPAAVLTLLAVLLLVHWLNIVVRSRSKWLLLDMIGLAVLGTVLWSLRDQLLSLQAFGAMVWIERFWCVGLPAVLWLAGLRQLELGRIDPVRGHRVYSLHAWTGLTVLTLVSAAYVSWITGGTVSDLKSLSGVSPNPTGSHMVVGGTLKGRAGLQGTFIVPLDVDPPSSVRSAGSSVPALFHWKWSGDGSRAVWARCKRLVPTLCELWTQDLAAGTEPRATGIAVRTNYIRLAVSHGGQLIALGHNSGVEVYATATGELIAAARTPDIVDLSFLSARQLRLVSFDPDAHAYRQVIHVFDIDSRESKVTGRIPGDVFGRFYTRSPEGGLLLFNSLVPRRLELRDAVSGEVVVDLTEMMDLNTIDLSSDHVLADARFVREDLLGVVWAPRKRTSLADQPTQDFEVLLLGLPSAVRPHTEIVTRTRVEQARDAQLGAELRTDALTVLVTHGSPTDAPVDPLLAGAGLEPLTATSTYLLHPGREQLELVAHGYIPVSVHRRTSSNHSSTAKLYATGNQALFTIKDGKAQVVFAGTERDRSESATNDYLSFRF